MRIDPKYFNKFLLIVAFLCVIAIIYFNFYYQQRQLVRIDERIGDGSVLVETQFRELGGEGEVNLSGLDGEKKMIIFWAPWSDRAVELATLLQEELQDLPVSVISAVVRDTPESVRNLGLLTRNNVWQADGTQVYNDLRIPGIPAIFVFDSDNRMIHYKIGYRESRDYEELISVLNQ
ncbi:MAG: TlpA family protein disulfide reductase [Cyclonatronaceae bacterium]